MTLGWQNPSALWALTLVALPVVIHLLRTHHARRVAFPTLRFVQPSRTAAVRMRMPSDVLLMLVRMGIVAAASAALAGPVLLTSTRLAAWDARIARAIVVDRSDSMRIQDVSGAAPEQAAAEAVEAERRTATYASQFNAANLTDGVARASRWLAAQPPARREVVVMSDLQRGAVDDALVNATGQGIGLRFVRVGRVESKASFEGLPLLSVPGESGRPQRVDLTVMSTSVAIETGTATSVPGIRIIAAPGADEKSARLLRAVATAGAYAGSADQPIVVRLSGAPTDSPGTVAPIKSGWMLRTVVRLYENESQSAPAKAPPSEGEGPWTTVVYDVKGQPLVRAAASSRELVIDVAATVDDIFAAHVTRAVLNARVDPDAYREHEIARLEDDAIDAITRQAAPVVQDAWRTAEPTDARWCWLLALLLLGAEEWLRARTMRQRTQEVTRAAA